jgi:hypothetical protein
VRKSPEAKRRRSAISLGSLLGRHGNKEEMRRGASVRLPIAMDIKREKIGAAILFEFSNKVDRR